MNYLLEELVRQAVAGNLNAAQAMEMAWEAGILEGMARQRLGHALQAAKALDESVEQTRIKYTPAARAMRVEGKRSRRLHRLRWAKQDRCARLCRVSLTVLVVAVSTWSVARLVWQWMS